MRYDAEIRVFDMLDLVHVSVRVFATDGLSQARPELVLEETRTLRGVGRSLPEDWLADALCPVVEELWAHDRPPGEEGLRC